MLPTIMINVGKVKSSLLNDLDGLHLEVSKEGERTFQGYSAHISREVFRSGALNLAHYLALRRQDRRDLQQSLLERGLSSLGRCESRVMANIEAGIAALQRIEGETSPMAFPSPERFMEGMVALDQNTDELFGPAPEGRRVRLMVTLPGEAATDRKLVRSLLKHGMDLARINCAHDNEETWLAMIQLVREESKHLNRTCLISMDLSGPKARLGRVHLGKDRERIFEGDRIIIYREGHLPAKSDFPLAECLLEEAIDQLKVGSAVWIDDGKAGTRVVKRSKHSITLECFHTIEQGFRLKSEKGLNFPGSELSVASLTPSDLKALDFVVQHADLVGFSFVQCAEDVQNLLKELSARGDTKLGIIAKIETERAVRNLPEILVAGAGQRPTGVMIARGDLAVEIGWERISEMQEEILWICEAAHVPVIWATQVLETLVKKGSPSRAEVTDAAMSERAECVMLNKGPYILDGMKLLVNVLHRMQEHQLKKMPRLRALRSWNK